MHGKSLPLSTARPGAFMIDYVFVRNGLKVLKYGILAETEGDAFLSDHAPVLVTVE